MRRRIARAEVDAERRVARRGRRARGGAGIAVTALRDQRRGPDDSGLHFGGGAAIGMSRLSIIDLQGSHQPLANEDQTV